MNRREEALQSAWAAYWDDDETCPPVVNSCFGYGFDSAWDALLSEIRPLVENLHALGTDQTFCISRHNAAVEKLRELVLEVE